MKIRNIIIPLLAMCAIILAGPHCAKAEYFRHLTLNDGLSQPSVMSIAQDGLGRIWLGTREGVNMYDGASLSVYKGWINDPDTGSKVWIGNEVSAIHPDSTGNLFMHIDHDVVKYNIVTDRFSRFTSGADVKALTGSNGQIIFITSDSICVKNPHNDSLIFQFSVPGLGNISHLAADAGAYYISTDAGLYIFDRKSRRRERLLPSTAIHSTFISSDNTLWISEVNGSLLRRGRSDKNPVKVSTPLAPKGVMGALQSRNAVEDHSGKIWYGTFTGLSCYDPATGHTRHIRIPTNIGGLTHSSVFGMLCDRQGNIWAGTYYGGVNYFSPADEQYFNFNYENLAPDGLYHSFIIAMTKDRDGNLWFGTDGAGVCCVDSIWNIRTTLSTKSGANALRQNNIKALAYHPGSNRLFIGTHLGGLSVYDIGTGTTTNMIDNQRLAQELGNVIHSLKVRGDNLFIASRTGLSRLDLTTDSIHHIATPTPPLFIDFDSDGNLYYFHQRGRRIYRVAHPEESSPEVVPLPRLLGNGAPSSFCCTDSGLLVSTIGDGIISFPGYGDTQIQYNTSNSALPDDYCYTIANGPDGSVYILTEHNVVRMKPDADMERVKFNDYFPDSHIIDDCALLPLQSGDILVGSTKGITRLSSSNFRASASTGGNPLLFFSKLRVQNREVIPGDGSGILDRALPYASRIRLPHNRNNFSLRLGLSDYTTSTGQPIVEYRLEGSDNNHWVTADDGEIRYNSLSPGSYTLHARQPDIPGEISIAIEVERPWYAGFWAWLIYIIAAAAIGYFIIHKSLDAARLRSSLRKEKIERNQIERLNKEKLVFFTNVSHEFQTPLTLIMSHVDLLMTKYKRNESLLEVLRHIRDHSRQMSHLITLLLEFRKLQQNHQVLRLGYHDAADALRHTALPFVDYATKRCIDFTIDIPDDVPKGFYDPALIDRVLVNILSNAFKYTPDGGSISCSIARGRGATVVFRISDTGKGISEKDLPYIFDRFYNGNSDEMKRYDMDYRSTGIGLAFAKSIVDKHHGRISVTSREGEGTTFTVELPSSPEPFEGDSNIMIDDTPSSAIPAFDEGPLPDNSPSVAASGPDDNDDPDNPSDEQELPLILIVEDNHELRRNLVHFFTPYFRLAEAADGMEGLEKARAINPDLIISDVMMPRMSGTEMCRTIKSDVNLCHIPVILLTALSASESRIEGLNANADDYVTKPFESAILLARVDNLIRLRKMLIGQFNKQPINEIDLSVVNPLDRDLLKRTSEVIDSRIDDPNLDISYICSRIGLSRSQFFAKFKSLTGMTPNTYIHNYRLKFAATLLSAQPQLSVADITYRVGFTNPAYFTRCFKKLFGVPPQSYRKTDDCDQAADSSDTN